MAKHEIVPDVSLFGKLGARSRAFPMVATELVDNSLDSWLLMPDSYKKGKTLEIDIRAKSTKGSWFVIKDNAGGMTEEELAYAMTVAHSTKDGSKVIGHFGFGLKSSAMYIGSKFRIFSRSFKEPKKIHFVEFDRSKFESSKKWSIDIKTLTLDEARQLDIVFKDGHGTEIMIVNERFKPQLEKGIVNRLKKTFAPRLPLPSSAPRSKKYHSTDSMEIFFNETRLLAMGPFYEVWKRDPESEKEEVGRGGQPDPALYPAKPMIEIPMTTINGKKVWGRAGILDRGMAHNNHYGFDLIKHYRVIELHALDRAADDKRIGLVASNHNARIVGQLFLDDWDTDHQKTEFNKDSDEWNQVAEHVGKAIKPLFKVSSNLQYNKVRAEDSPADGLAAKGARDSAPIINKGVQRAFRSGAIQKTISRIEARQPKAKLEAKGSLKKDPRAKPMISSTRLFHTKPFADYGNNGTEQPLVKTKHISDKTGDRLKVLINLDHPFLQKRESAELKAIGEFLTVDAFSEYILKNKNLLSHDDFLELRDRFLKELRTTK